MRNICIVLGSRANYGSIKSVMKLIQADLDLNLQIILTSSALSEKFGNLVPILEKDGFKIDYKLTTLLESSTPSSMSKTTALNLIEISSALDYLDPEIVFTIGDRYETIATAIATSYSNRILAHTMGGEISGTIDESVRHAVTKLAHLHFVSTLKSQNVVKLLGENPKNVYLTGCPRIDLVREALSISPSQKLNIVKEIFESRGVGTVLDHKKPFIVLALHPVTSEWRESQSQIKACLNAIKMSNIQALVIWPNADAGSNYMAQEIRVFRENNDSYGLKFINDLSPDEYFIVLELCSVLVGNSSSGIREGSYIGTPFVNIGSRQNNREVAHNVLNSDFDYLEIGKAIQTQLNHGKYESLDTYGDGLAAGRILDIIKRKLPNSQKSFFVNNISAGEL